MSTNVIMPEMGEGVDEGTVVRWLKQEGDRVEYDDPILEIETDKVTVEITAEAEGILLKINAAEGDLVAAGTVLAVIGEADEAVETAEIQAVSALETGVADTVQSTSAGNNNGSGAMAPAVPANAGKKAAARSFDGVRVSPVVARMLEAHDINVNELAGTGRDGRITKQDVLDYLETVDQVATPSKPEPAKRPASPVPASAPPPEQKQPEKSAQPDSVLDDGDEVQPLTGMRRAIAEHMVNSKRTSPHATTVFEFDFSAIARHRAENKERFARDGVKLTFTPYIVGAVAAALKDHPMVNASWSDDGIVLKRSINIGMAVAVPQGLIVPVINGADSMNLLGLARAVNDLSERARNNQLAPAETRGGTFTISNHGVSGSLIGMPIINQPQVGIIGVGKIEKRVKVINDAIAIRPCAYVSFSFDHRVLDGVTADAFISQIQESLENFSG